MYQVGQSGYNAIMSNWMLNADATNDLDLDCLAAKGTLSPQAIDFFSYDTGTGEISLEWNSAPVGNQLATDVLKVLVFDKSSGLLYFEDTIIARSTAAHAFDITPGLTFGNLTIYCFFVQGSGSTMIVSDSVAHVATAP